MSTTNIQQHNIQGLSVYTAEIPQSRSTTIEVFVKAGSVYETLKTNGISHFLEHMFFKWGKTYPTPMAVAQTVDAFGGEFNAYTGNEYAGYYIKCAPTHIEKALDVLADMLVHAQFPKEELEREKGVVIQEIKMYDDIPQRQVVHKRQERYYGNNSYGWTTLWPVNNIKTFTQDHLFQHKNSLYTKDNMCIVIAGALPAPEKYIDLMHQLFDGLPSQATFPKPALPTYRPNTSHHCEQKGTQQNHLIISADGSSMHDPDIYATKLAANILGGSMSSRLFQEIREKRGLCYYVHGQHHASDQDGVYMIRAGIEKERWEFGRKAIIEQIHDIAAGNITEEEYMTARGNLTWSLNISLETSDQLASFIGTQALFKDQIQTPEEILHKYHHVTHDEIKKAAQRLAPDRLYSYRLE